MLTLDELRLRQESPFAASYWCEAIAHTPTDGLSKSSIHAASSA